MPIATVIVTICLAGLFAFAGSIKLLGVKQSLAIRDRLGISPSPWRIIGVLEWAGVAGVLAGLAWPPIGIAAAVGLTLLSVGAIVSHVRSSDGITDTAPAVIGFAARGTTAVLLIAR
jgi:DoxX-like family